jgi:hypothetical protein
MFKVRRHALTEFNAYGTNRRVYARQIPEPQLVQLSEIRAQLAKLREQIAALEVEEQSVLLTAAQNGQRVRVEEDQ